MNLLSSWSGGKDSCYALIKAIEAGHTPKILLNIMNENGKISRSHGLTKNILEQQANAVGIPIYTKPSSWADYEAFYIESLKKLKIEHDLDAAVFGDIDLQPHRDWEEKVCKEANLQALLPLWQGDRKTLVYEMIETGIKAVIVSCNTDLGFEFLGRTISKSLVEELEAIGVDACGENGEYHTAVIDCPIFKQPVKLPKYEKVQHGNYCFLSWEE